MSGNARNGSLPVIAVRAALGLLLLLTACSIEGGVPPAAPAGSVPTSPVAPTVALSPGVAPATIEQDSTDTLTIGLLAAERPRDLLPYHDDSTDARNSATVTGLLFPPPLLTVGYSYTTTGVLEQVPSLENGGATLQDTDVYLDAAGNITTTVTEVITKAQQIVVTYRWNPALRWSDGTLLTADDSVFAYELAKQAPLGEEAAARLALLDRYEAVDPHTTRAFLKPDFLDSNYMLSVWTPLPRHLLKDLPPGEFKQSPWASQPVGYGPYAFEREDSGVLRLRRNQNFFGTPPLAERINIAFLSGVDALRVDLLNGKLDLASADRLPVDQIPFLAQDQQGGLLQVFYTPGPVWEHLDFNLDVPLLQDIRVRRAIAHGTNRQGMLETLFGGKGQVLDSWLLPGQWAAAPADQLTRYAYDPGLAIRLLDEVGILDGDGDGVRELQGAPATVRLVTTGGTPLREQAAQSFKQDMGAIGLAIEVQTLPISELYASDGPLFQRRFELALFAWIAGPDPAGFSLWSCKAVPSLENGWTGNNFAGWCFREADQSISVATTSLDRAERQQAYLRQQQLFTQELPSLPLFQRISLALVSPQLSGVQPDPLAPITWNIATWQRKP